MRTEAEIREALKNCEHNAKTLGGRYAVNYFTWIEALEWVLNEDKNNTTEGKNEND